MQMKLFEAFSMKDAIKAVKTEFGSDAVILNTKRKMCQSSGRELVEVTAAKMKTREIGGASSEFGALMEKDVLFLQDKLEKLQQDIAQVQMAMVKKHDLELLESHFFELKAILVEQGRKQSGDDFSGLDAELKSVVDRLLLMGIAPTTIKKIIATVPPTAHIDKKNLDEADKFELYRSYAIAFMLRHIKVVAPIGTGNISDIHAFVGASGSGKTSMVCKLAADLHSQHKKKVQILSLDNSKLAAADQLKVFSKLVGVDCEVVSSPLEIKDIILKKGDLECVLIDTAGKSPKRGSQLDDLKSLKSVGIPIDFHLVLSATDKEIQMEKNIRYFSALSFKNLAFSKLDESFSYGEIFNVLHKWKKPLSYFGIGAGLTDAIEAASQERIIERIFGL